MYVEVCSGGDISGIVFETANVVPDSYTWEIANPAMIVPPISGATIYVPASADLTAQTPIGDDYTAGRNDLPLTAHATITVYATYTHAPPNAAMSCKSDNVAFDLAVRPAPKLVSTPEHITVCAGEEVWIPFTTNYMTNIFRCFVCEMGGR